MKEFEQNEKTRKAIEEAEKAKAKIHYWAEIFVFFGFGVGTVVGCEYNMTFGSLICVASAVLFMKMKSP
ncbi:MAG TPA: hypothetical protein ENJ95_15675 [Bacteroidetes bacterium]|nr:hypothetical protein [Bacteroidota bacterium]